MVYGRNFLSVYAHTVFRSSYATRGRGSVKHTIRQDLRVLVFLLIGCLAAMIDAFHVCPYGAWFHESRISNPDLHHWTPT